MKGKRLRVLKVRPRLVCRWGLQTKPDPSDSRQGRRLAYRCHDCGAKSHFRSFLEIPALCPCCDNGRLTPHWAKRTRNGLIDHTFEYSCKICNEISTFESDVEIPDKCPKCGKAKAEYKSIKWGTSV